MKHTSTLILTGALIWMAGCASPTKIADLQPIGPAPASVSRNSGDGSLQVYSARQQVGFDPNVDEWLWNNDFGRNEFQYLSAHTDYAVYGQNGRLIQRVCNTLTENSAEPAPVSLPPGRYEIRAKAEDYAGALDVRVPVVIRAGQTTAVHLVNGWKPRRRFTRDELARLPDGELAGWLATR